MTTISAVANYLTENAELLSKDMVNDILARIGLEIPKEEVEVAITVYTEFIGFLGNSLECDEESVPEALIAWSKQNGEQTASQTGKISTIINRYPPTRLAFIDKISEVCKQHDLSVDEVVTIIKRVSFILDISINETVLAFERYNESLIEIAKAELNELSAPIVPIQDGLAVLPLIGSIDYDRAMLIMEKVIPRISKLGLDCIIIDFSGLSIIDTNVAKYIFDIHSVLNLLGINAIATGIRPEIAQAVVSSGIEFASIKTYSNVKQAIDSMNA